MINEASAVKQAGNGNFKRRIKRAGQATQPSMSEGSMSDEPERQNKRIGLKQQTERKVEQNFSKRSGSEPTM